MEVYLCWVPSHTGVNGNKRADGAALCATQFDYITPSPIPKNYFKNFIKDQVNSLWATEWDNIVENKVRVHTERNTCVNTTHLGE